MLEAILVVSKSEIASGDIRKFDFDGKEIAVYNLNGAFYATQDGCTHAKASLSEGEIVDDMCIECPVHGGLFHIPTGQAVAFPCERPIRTYKVTDTGDSVQIDLALEADEAAQTL